MLDLSKLSRDGLVHYRNWVYANVKGMQARFAEIDRITVELDENGGDKRHGEGWQDFDPKMLDEEKEN